MRNEIKETEKRDRDRRGHVREKEDEGETKEVQKCVDGNKVRSKKKTRLDERRKKRVKDERQE